MPRIRLTIPSLLPPCRGQIIMRAVLLVLLFVIFARPFADALAKDVRRITLISGTTMKEAKS